MGAMRPDALVLVLVLALWGGVVSCRQQQHVAPQGPQQQYNQPEHHRGGITYSAAANRVPDGKAHVRSTLVEAPPGYWAQLAASVPKRCHREMAWVVYKRRRRLYAKKLRGYKASSSSSSRAGRRRTKNRRGRGSRGKSGSRTSRKSLCYYQWLARMSRRIAKALCWQYGTRRQQGRRRHSKRYQAAAGERLSPCAKNLPPLYY